MAKPGSTRYVLNLARALALACLVVAPLYAVLMVYRAATFYTSPPRTRAAITPAALGLPYQEVPLRTADGVSLAAWYVPGASRGAIVFVHGHGSNRGDMLPVARDLVRVGFHALLLDLRAHGDSGGEVSTLGVRERFDIAAALDYLQAQPGVDSQRIGALGLSLGAATVLQTAATEPRLRAVVADSAFASLDWLAAHQFTAFVRLPPQLAPLVVQVGSERAGINPREVSAVDAIGAIAPRPVLLIHGEGDTLIPPENTRMLAAAAGPSHEVWLVPSVGHGGAYDADPVAYVARVQRFFEDALGND